MEPPSYREATQSSLGGEKSNDGILPSNSSSESQVSEVDHVTINSGRRGKDGVFDVGVDGDNEEEEENVEYEIKVKLEEAVERDGEEEPERDGEEELERDDEKKPERDGEEKPERDDEKKPETKIHWSLSDDADEEAEVSTTAYGRNKRRSLSVSSDAASDVNPRDDKAAITPATAAESDESRANAEKASLLDEKVKLLKTVQSQTSFTSSSSSNDFWRMSDASPSTRRFYIPNTRKSSINSGSETISLTSSRSVSEILHEKDENEEQGDLSNEVSRITDAAAEAAEVTREDAAKEARRPRSISECLVRQPSGQSFRRGRFLVQRSGSSNSANSNVTIASKFSEPCKPTQTTQTRKPTHPVFKRQQRLTSSGSGQTAVGVVTVDLPGIDTPTVVNCGTQTCALDIHRVRQTKSEDGSTIAKTASNGENPTEASPSARIRASFFKRTISTASGSSHTSQKSLRHKASHKTGVDTVCQTEPALLLPSGKLIYSQLDHGEIQTPTPASPKSVRSVVIIQPEGSDEVNGGAADVKPLVDEEKPAMPPDYILLSCLVLCCCNLPFGIAALILSLKSQQSYEGDDYKKSLRQSRLSLYVAVSGILLTVILVVILLAVYWPSLPQPDQV